MDANTIKVKKKLQEEFCWLQEHYPLPAFGSIELYVYDAHAYNHQFGELHQDVYQEKEVDAFVMETIEQGVLQHALFLIIDTHHTPDEVDCMVLEKGNILPKHLSFFLLYHEYGHLVHLHDSFIKKGIAGYLEEKEEMEEALDRLLMERERNNLPEITWQTSYRNLWFERLADDFAYHVYPKRKETLEEY